MAKCSEIVAKNIKSRLRSTGESQADLARRCGVAPAYLSQLLSGANKNPTVENLELVANALEITLAELVTDPKEFRALGQHSMADCLKATARMLHEIDYGDVEAVVAALVKSKP